MNKATYYSGFETQRRHHQKSKTGVSEAPQKELQKMSSKNFFKKVTYKPLGADDPQPLHGPFVLCNNATQTTFLFKFQFISPENSSPMIVLTTVKLTTQVQFYLCTIRTMDYSFS